MPKAVTKDQFEWEGDVLVHKPSGARFSATAGFVGWSGNHGPPANDDFDPIDVGFIAGQVLAARREPTDPA